MFYQIKTKNWHCRPCNNQLKALTQLMHHFVFLSDHYFFFSLKTQPPFSSILKNIKISSTSLIMKKKLFSCFHPLTMETDTDQINVDPNKKKLLKISDQKSNSRRPFSEILEILLLKASLVSVSNFLFSK